MCAGVYYDSVCVQVSGQEDMSYKPVQRRLYAPLWPSSLGVTDRCRYASAPSSLERPSQEAGQRGEGYITPGGRSVPVMYL